MSIDVGVIDYGMGNLHSVAKAIATQGGRVRVSDSVSELSKAQLLVLPGVGAFGAAMEILAEKKLDRFVRDWVESKRPYFGICLGFQLLFDSSEESPGVRGLGLVPGNVVRFRFSALQKKKLKIPHMGWNSVMPTLRDKSYFKGIPSDEPFYFVHSYYPVPKMKSDVGAVTSYGKKFCSAIHRNNLFACQFHPEKSGDIGLKLIRNILKKVS